MQFRIFELLWYYYDRPEQGTRTYLGRLWSRLPLQAVSESIVMKKLCDPTRPTNTVGPQGRDGTF